MEHYSKIVCERKLECESYYFLLERRLTKFSILNWFTVLLPSILGVGAASIYFAGPEHKEIIAIFTGLAALLSAIHKGLNCESHQSECRRLMSEYRALVVAYRSLGDIEPEDYRVALLTLESKFAELAKTDTVSIMKPNKFKNENAS